MKRIYGIVAAIIIVICAMLIGFAPRHYETKEACLKSELRGKKIIFQLEGTDSELICYETLIDGELTLLRGILRNVDGEWTLYKPVFNSKLEFEVFFASGTIVGYDVQQKASADKYIFLTEGPTYSEKSELSIYKWGIQDNLDSEFYLIDTYASGSEIAYYVACIPASTKGYTLQFGKWIIRDLDLNQPWNKTKAKVELIEEVGGLS